MFEFEIYNPTTRMSEWIYGTDEITAMESSGFNPKYWHVVSVYEVPDIEDLKGNDEND